MNIERLHTLYEHLKRGKLGHKKFDFGVYNDGPQDKKGCGTAGCAIGECPMIWEEWEFREAVPKLRSGLFSVTESAEIWFEINYQEFKHLFLPDGQNPNIFGGKRVYRRATRDQVADNIKTFMELKFEKELEASQ